MTVRVANRFAVLNSEKQKFKFMSAEQMEDQADNRFSVPRHCKIQTERTAPTP